MFDTELISILAVDDRPENLLALVNSIDIPNVEVDTANSANDGLKMLLKKEYALAILDVQMPGMNGFEMAELMRTTRKTQHIPIIFVTAISNEERHVFKGYDSGAVDYLFKPLDVHVFNSKLKVFIELYGQRKELDKKNEELTTKVEMLEDLSAELEQQTLQLEQMNTELNSFAHTVSHDLKSPVRQVHGLVSLLLDDCLKPESREIIDEIMRRTASMNQLIEDLLAFSETSHKPLERKTVDLSKMAEDILASLGAKLEEQTLEVDVEEGMTIRADQAMIRIVMDNLLGNAIKYSGEKEAIKIQVGMKTEGNRPVWFVSDNGCGFDMTHSDRIFQPFQRLHSSSQFPGTGIGLSTVERILNRHNMEIWVESQKGKGSTFYFGQKHDK